MRSRIGRKHTLRLLHSNRRSNQKCSSGQSRDHCRKRARRHMDQAEVEAAPVAGSPITKSRTADDRFATCPTRRHRRAEEREERRVRGSAVIELKRRAQRGGGDNKPSLRSIKKTPSRRQRRCRSQGSDLRGYFHATKPNLRTGKRNSLTQRNSSSPVVIDGFYQSTPRVDADIGPLTVYPQHHQSTTSSSSSSSCSSSSLASSLAMTSQAMSSTLMTTTLPVDPQTLLIGSCFPSHHSQQPMTLQSHVSDFFHQISMATSPEDVMEFDSLRFDRNRLAARTTRFASSHNHNHHYNQHSSTSKLLHTPHLPKHARSAKLSSRTDTPYHVHARDEDSERRKQQMPLPLIHHRNDEMRMEQDEEEEERIYEEIQETPSKGKSSGTKLERNNKPNNLYEDVDSLRNSTTTAASPRLVNCWTTRRPRPGWYSARRRARPTTTTTTTSEFPLRRQRVIRRKRTLPQASSNNNGPQGSVAKRPKMGEELPLIEAVNRHVKRLALETDLDLSTTIKTSADEGQTTMQVDDEPQAQRKEEDAKETRPIESGRVDERRHGCVIDVDEPEQQQQPQRQQNEESPITSRKRCPINVVSGSHWESPCGKSSSLALMMSAVDSFATPSSSDSERSSPCSRSGAAAIISHHQNQCSTPEATPLVATVRRCLEYSPETPSEYGSGSNTLRNDEASYGSAGGGGNSSSNSNRGSIEVECSSTDDRISVKTSTSSSIPAHYQWQQQKQKLSSSSDSSEAKYCVRTYVVRERLCVSLRASLNYNLFVYHNLREKRDREQKKKLIRCRDLRRVYEPEGPIHAYVKAHIKDLASGEARCRVERTAVHRATPNPVFNEVLRLTLPPNNGNNNNNNNSSNGSSNDRDTSSNNSNNSSSSSSSSNGVRRLALDIAVWHRDRVARPRSVVACTASPSGLRTTMSCSSSSSRRTLSCSCLHRRRCWWLRTASIDRARRDERE
ncbi:unnamed protein product [Trichogramma brassicae]|uniref:C2 domain-containing protein n=1 Tax=Trichogramma brassicae TaxID=86971 RepID=A0A6H5IPA7_9HYME|nr:unnamed protein product [Trichogramma brassicae]